LEFRRCALPIYRIFGVYGLSFSQGWGIYPPKGKSSSLLSAARHGGRAHSLVVIIFMKGGAWYGVYLGHHYCGGSVCGGDAAECQGAQADAGGAGRAGGPGWRKLLCGRDHPYPEGQEAGGVLSAGGSAGKDGAGTGDAEIGRATWRG